MSGDRAPKHIRWLHDRWSNNSGEASTSHQRKSKLENDDSISKKRRKHSDKDAASNDNLSSYFQWRYGGAPNGLMLTFKEFLIAYPKEVEQQEQAIVLYNEYKLNFKKWAYENFFNAHQDEEWFLEKYHPLYKLKAEVRMKKTVQVRLDAFMFLLVRGWIETPVEYTDNRNVRKLLDAACVLLEGGSENDLTTISDLDYVLEEKREESYEAARIAEDDDEEIDLDEEKKKEKGANDEEENGVDKATKLELLQHARDYSSYVEDKQKKATSINELPQDINDMPDIVTTTKSEIKHVGRGVFLGSSFSTNETKIHQASALVIRNVHPSVTHQELEEMCVDAHGGFQRVFMCEPDPEEGYCRKAIVSFTHNANLTKTCWLLRNKRLRGKPLMVDEYRTFAKRVEYVDGLAADKSVVLRDVQLCKSLIEHLDGVRDLWIPKEDEEQNEGQVCINPLLLNLDECLAFHLQEIIKSGGDGAAIGDLLPDEENKEKAKRRICRDLNLTRILDRLILYLRIVHSIDYYGCKWLEHEDEEPKRVGVIHLRGPGLKSATPEALANYIKKFEDKLKNMLPNETKLADEHVELLGKKSVDGARAEFIKRNIVSAVKDGMSECLLCSKRFTSLEFARQHFEQRHADKLEDTRFTVAMFNNYLSDPQRPCDLKFAP